MPSKDTKPTRPSQDPQYLSIRGAREHNLKNIHVDIPRNALTVLTGLSGSGKSSLAFDTIYAEGQRRYVESLSAYARQFLELMPKPDVDAIEGLSPAISIEQKTASRNPRSTVGTVTEIYDYLRLLYARVGIPYSPATGLPIESQSASQMVDLILARPPGSRLYILAPLVRGRKGEYRKELGELRKKGFERVKVDGTFYTLEDVPALEKNIKHTIEVVVDRVVITQPDELRVRLSQSVEKALDLGDGLLIIEDAQTNAQQLFSAKFACPVSGFTLEEIEPRLFSFNSPYGACKTCDGLGLRTTFTLDKVVPDDHLTIEQGAIVPWSGSFSFYYQQILKAVIAHCEDDEKKPFRELNPKTVQALLYGTGNVKVPMSLQMTAEDDKKRHKSLKPFEGVIPSLTRRYQETDNPKRRDDLMRFQTMQVCESCKGARLRPEALAVKVAGKRLPDVTALSIEKAILWAKDLENHLSDTQKLIAEKILKEIGERLGFLGSVGLGYLSLARGSGSLSGGESQRIRLASQIGSGLTGVLYVLDEPSIGLHQRDNDRLLATLTRLRDLGNTVLVVEHDADTIRASDYILDMGPGAGVHGGEIVAQGALQDILDNPESLTGQYLTGARSIPVPSQVRAGHGTFLTLTGARGNNLQNLTAIFPLGCFICVSGVSGGGKSTLIVETLYKAVAKTLQGSSEEPAPYDDLKGLEHLDKIIDIDQSPIGRTPRSNPATYTGLFGPIRDWFAALPESKARAYGPGRFSFNVKGGRCESCQGDGVTKIEMHFLPDVYVECETCKGRRYNRETLDVTYKGKSIADVLDMTVEEGISFFEAITGIRERLKTLHEVGLGYLQIGQRATTLSGGEAQRVKLAKELSKRATGKTLYILDEPTTGLHFDDVRKLLEVLHRLVDQGNTLIIIEHNLDVIKTADWILDLGPEGGEGGGRLVGQGTPQDLANDPNSITGVYLKPYLTTTL